MPCAPKDSQSKATLSTSGLFPPRALRIVATLLMFTLNFVILYNNLLTIIALSQIKNVFLQHDSIQATCSSRSHGTNPPTATACKNSKCLAKNVIQDE